jgi:hypothetical protein
VLELYFEARLIYTWLSIFNWLGLAATFFLASVYGNGFAGALVTPANVILSWLGDTTDAAKSLVLGLIFFEALAY